MGPGNGRMWASAPTRVTGTRRSGGHTSPPLIPSCRGRRPRRPASSADNRQASASGKRTQGYPGPPRAQGFPKDIAFHQSCCEERPTFPRRRPEVRAPRGPTRRSVFFSWTGRGPFVSGLSAAAHAAVGLRHAPAGAVFSARPNGVPARAQRSGSRGERRSKGSGRSFRIGAPAAPCAVGRAGAAE